MKLRTLLLFYLVITSLCQAQDPTALDYAEGIDSVRMISTIKKMSSEKFAGRETNTIGNKLTTQYITKLFREYQMKQVNGTYEQNIGAYNRTPSQKYFHLSHFNYQKSYTYDNRTFQDSVITGNEIVFAGYGIYHNTYNDFAKLDIKDKIVLLLEGDGPTNAYGSPCHQASYVPNMEYISSQKPRALLMIEDEFDSYRNYNSERLIFHSGLGKQSIPEVKINELLANRILEPANKTVKQLKYEIERQCKSENFSLRNEIQLNGNYSYDLADDVNNMVCTIEGSDLKDEYIVLSAHYDHIGTNYSGKVYPGADDNATGVSAVLEIARLLNKAKKEGHGPLRTVVILLTAAEENGLYGSKHYVQHPLFPLNNTLACLNIDMLGRSDANVDEELKEKGYLYALTGTREINDSLFHIPDTLNKLNTNLSLLSSQGSYSSFYSRSDHYNFFNEGIPSVFFTSGSHKDLHRTTDTADKIELNALVKRTQLIFLTLWELANNPEPFQ